MDIVVLLMFQWSFLSLLAQNPHPLSDDYIAWINNQQTHWKAGKNFEIADWQRVKKMASGVWRKAQPVSNWMRLNTKQVNLPNHFDARVAWVNCTSIRQIWDQSNCGSCWALSAAAAMSDRICIHSNQKLQVYVSAEDLLSCCWQCGNGCSGGDIPKAWWYWQAYGISSGGLYNSSQGCKDYTLPPCEHHNNISSKPHCDDLNLQLGTPRCVHRCHNSSLSYFTSLTFGGQLKKFSNERQIQLEIAQHGPVEGAIEVFEDFFNYKSGVYKRTSDKYIGGHAIKILGWGEENGIPYWLCTNSWNSDWGDGGYFKIIRGENHCGVEDQVFASLPVFI